MFSIFKPTHYPSMVFGFKKKEKVAKKHVENVWNFEFFKYKVEIHQKLMYVKCVMPVAFL